MTIELAPLNPIVDHLPVGLAQILLESPLLKHGFVLAFAVELVSQMYFEMQAINYYLAVKPW